MSKLFKWIIVVVAILFIAFFVLKNIGTINIPGNVSNNDEDNLPNFSVPAGFSIEIFAKNVPGARVIEMDPKGRILVSQTSEGKIVALTNKDSNSASDERKILIDGLKKPHGLAMNCESDESCFLYVAEADSLSRFPYDHSIPSLGKKEKLMDIEYSLSDRHFTRSIIFLPFPDQDTLLVSVGSSCNVCYEKDSHHASVLSYNIKTGKKEIFAKGLRNAVFMNLNPVSGKVYATEMGRDSLGDDIPPDEINIIEKGKNYGWPICYGKNVHDDQFDKNTYIRNPCMEPFETPSFVDLQAHSAPLGLAFIPEEGWPEEYWYNLIVAYHGSWNRSIPTGYKMVRIKINAKGEYLGTEDFITGWLTQSGKKVGRPVDIKILSGGVAYISDDDAGIIYRMSRRAD